MQSIELDGSYEVHDGQRSYSFYTELNNTYKFLITSNVLNYVQIVKARFETLRSEPSGTSEYIFTRFSFWGCLNFKDQPGFDLFSFGSETTAELSDRQGLYFSNLGLAMDFKLLADETTVDRGFIFDAGRASYDISQSQVRPDSLVNRFPMKVTSILQNDGSGRPKDLGYLSVRTPKDFKAASLSDEWYAINFELNLGSMGALAQKAGFSAGLLLAWSPSESIRTEVDIKLPGTGGGKKTLAIMGDGFAAGADQTTYNNYVRDQVMRGVFLSDAFNEDSASWNIRRVNLESANSGASTRTWNLMIDVIAQTGKYAPGTANLNDPSKFIVQGEKRYWLHIALDRDAGTVLGTQLEEVVE